jgi:hypothetical protein
MRFSTPREALDKGTRTRAGSVHRTSRVPLDPLWVHEVEVCQSDRWRCEHGAALIVWFLPQIKSWELHAIGMAVSPWVLANWMPRFRC